MLLNAVRASLDLPLSFTKLQRFTAGNMANGSFAPKLPFGPQAASAFDLGPMLSWSSGVQSIEYADVNNGTALAKLNESLQYGTFDRYVGQGFSGALLETILSQYVEVHADLSVALVSQYHRMCSGPAKQQSDYRVACEQLRDIRARCKKLWFDDPPIRLEGRQYFHVVLNRADTACDYLNFRSLGLMLGLSGYGADLKLETKKVPMKSADGKTVVVETTVAEQIVNFQEPRVQRAFHAIESRLKSYENCHAIKHTFRSPKSLLSYLGELIALQNYSADKYVPEIVLRGGKRLTVFRVIRGNPGSEQPALAVRGPHGDTFYVPEPDYGSPTRDQTLRVLALASEVVNAAISEKDIPPPTSVVVQAIQ